MMMEREPGVIGKESFSPDARDIYPDINNLPNQKVEFSQD
jgi:hypothetical protein